MALKKVAESGDAPKSVRGDKEIKHIGDCSQHWLDNYVTYLKPSTQHYYKFTASRFFVNSFFSYDVEKARFDEWNTYFDKIAKKQHVKTQPVH